MFRRLQKFLPCIYLVLHPLPAYAHMLHALDAYVCGQPTAQTFEQSSTENETYYLDPIDPSVAAVAKLDILEQELSDGRQYVVNCSASVIAPDWLLSAAHCVTQSQWQRIDVTLGTTDLASQNKIIRTVTQAICHKDYDPTSLENDIALLRLNRPVPADFMFMKLSAQSIKPQTQALTAGWYKVNAQTISRTLRKAPMQILGKENEYFIIAEPRKKLKHALCLGESGAPLVAQSKSSSFEQIGIFSAVEGRRDTLTGIVSEICLTHGSRSYFTPVSKYLKWIAKIKTMCRKNDCY